MTNSHYYPVVRRIAVLGVLIAALGVLMLERPPEVKAISCGDAFLDFSACYYYCAVQNDSCLHGNNPAVCPGLMDNCLRGCDSSHVEMGSACELLHYSQPFVPNATCEETAARLTANCISGAVPFAYRDSYFSCMTEMNGDPSYLQYCCGIAEENYLYIGCY